MVSQRYPGLHGRDLCARVCQRARPSQLAMQEQCSPGPSRSTCDVRCDELGLTPRPAACLLPRRRAGCCSNVVVVPGRAARAHLGTKHSVPRCGAGAVGPLNLVRAISGAPSPLLSCERALSLKFIYLVMVLPGETARSGPNSGGSHSAFSGGIAGSSEYHAPRTTRCCCHGGVRSVCCLYLYAYLPVRSPCREAHR